MKKKAETPKLTYKEVCGDEPCVWFTVKDMKREGKEFLQWAKDLGCVWMNGEEIDPSKGTDFFTLAINADGTLANVSVYARMARKQSKHPAKIVSFSEYKRRGTLQSSVQTF